MLLVVTKAMHRGGGSQLGCVEMWQMKTILHSHLGKEEDGEEAGGDVCWAGTEGKLLEVEDTEALGHKESYRH